MARKTHDREDLLRDATGLVPRVLLTARLGDAAASVFAGFRGEALSLYFDGDPVFQFNARGELRRAFVGGRAIKAEIGQLIALERAATATAVELHAHTLDKQQSRELLSNMCRRLAELRTALHASSFIVAGQSPPDGYAIPRLIRWLADNPGPSPAASPRVG